MNSISIFLLLWGLGISKYFILGRGKKHNIISQYALNFTCIYYILFHSNFLEGYSVSILNHLFVWMFYGVSCSDDTYSVLQNHYNSTNSLTNTLKTINWIDNNRIVTSIFFVLSVILLYYIYFGFLYLLKDKYYNLRKKYKKFSFKRKCLQVLILSYLNLTTLSLYQLIHIDIQHSAVLLLSCMVLIGVTFGLPFYTNYIMSKYKDQLLNENIENN